MATTAQAETRTNRNGRTQAQLRADRWALVGAAIAGIFVAIIWVLRRTWRRILPAYWAGAELLTVWACAEMGVPWATVALAVLVVTILTVAWPARSWPVRVWRIAIASLLGGYAVATLAAGPHTLTIHPTLAVFGPCLLAAVLGWPWWHYLRYRTVAEPEPAVDESLTEKWAARWKAEVVDHGVCAGTHLIRASSPRRGVTEATIRLAPGTKTKAIMAKGSEVEVALDLDEGAVGWRSTGKAAKVQIVIVERSYISDPDGVRWTGPTYNNGRCQLTTFSDGTPGLWTFLRPGFGVLNGLVVGSTGAGKSRALGVLIENLLHGGWQVIVGDPQNGQSLPDWKDAVGEYHDSVDAVTNVLRRYHAEVMRRSKMLARAGVNVFDERDPRVRSLGLGKMMLIIDECQLVLLPDNKAIVGLAEEIAATDRKTGAGLILATQLPQMRSLGGSIRLRDATVAGNAFIMRLSNRGSGTTVMPDGFIGDPFSLPAEIDGRTTAGMGYLRSAAQVGMLSRVPNLDEAVAAANCPRVPVVWQVDEVDPRSPIPATAASSAGTGGAAAKLRAAFGVRPAQQPEPISTPGWVLACLRRAPASAQALLDRPDCPVKQPQLYAVLANLAKAGKINAPAQRGLPYTIA